MKLIIAVLLASTIGFAAISMRESKLAWNCMAEDEVVVIDGSCRHVDTLQNAIRCDEVITYKDGEITCELFIRESRQQNVLTNGYVTQEDRI